jgi:hypothetical protein
MAVPREPSERELRAWFVRHQAGFAIPAKRSFDQRYFATDKRGDAAARVLAAQTARTLTNGTAASGSEEFPGPKTIARLSADDIDRLFGGADFAKAVFAAKPGRWTGPVRSGFGWHAIRVTEAMPTRLRSFEEARREARLAWQDQDRAARNDVVYRQLLSHYTINRADRP